MTLSLTSVKGKIQLGQNTAWFSNRKGSCLNSQDVLNTASFGNGKILGSQMNFG